MTNATTNAGSQTSNKVFIKMALDAWHVYIGRADKLFDSLPGEQWQNETSPGRNTGIYLLGHMVAVHDAMISILGFGERLYPHLDKIFVESPDKSGQQMPPVEELKKYWKNVNSLLADHFSRIPEDEWFTRHNRVSEADFEKEPHRNKLNIIVNRTNHLAYHLGQMVYLEKK